MAPSPRLPLALTIGEPAGIGPDITLAAWRRRAEGGPPFYCIGDAELIRSRAERLGWDVPIALAEPGDAAARFDHALPVIALSGRLNASPGAPDMADVPLIIEAIDRAVDDVAAGRAAGVVTNPISKAALTRGGFTYPGHTEYLGHLSQERFGRSLRPVMMIAGPELRTIPVTIHVPLADVANLLTTELIVETGAIVAKDLINRFGIARPRLAIAGLNPHAGEDGTIGEEDKTIVAPAVVALAAMDIADVTGPHPADTLFHQAARQRYDAALCMYHDQALIPAKTLAFDSAVNVTLGLPFIRTSPDHGTAFDLAGTGKADPSSLIAALRLAAEMAAAGQDG
jgi:4-hydroxythreonine-4-phosphate dehydrogenase